MNNDFEIFREDAKRKIIDAFEEGYTCYLCDLHNELFNLEPEYINNDDAVNALGNEVFDAISKIVKYEKDNFSEVNTDFSSPYAVANMLFYIIGEETFYELFDGCELYYDLWNEELDEEKCKKLLQWLKDNEKINNE